MDLEGGRGDLVIQGMNGWEKAFHIEGIVEAKARQIDV